MTEKQLTVALVLLALELRCPVETLVRRFEGSIVLDEAGLRAITVEHSRAYLAEVRADAEEIHRRALRAAAEAAARPNPMKERVRAIQAKQAALGDAVDGGAFARMLEADGSRDAQLDRAARDRAEMLGQVNPTYHKITED